MSVPLPPPPTPFKSPGFWRFWLAWARGAELPHWADPWSEWRRKALVLCSPLGALGCLAGIAAQLPDVDRVDLWLLPILGITVLSVAALVARRRLAISAALGVVYAISAVYLLAMLAEQYALNVGRQQHLSEAVYWFPALYCLAFLVWELRRAALVVGVTYLISVAITLAYAPLFAARGQWTVVLVAALVQFFLAQAVLAVFLTSFAFVKQRLAQMHTLVYLDFLTSLPNRRFVEEKVQGAEMVRRAPLSVVIFDVDHFKRVNDDHGHHTGDFALRELAQIAGRFVRGGATLARWGGEEFVLLLPDLRESEAAAIVEHLRGAVADHRFDTVGRMTASFGVAQARDDELFHDTLRRADHALYRAKRAGRNRVVSAQAS